MDDQESRILRERVAASMAEAAGLGQAPPMGGAPMLVKTRTVGTYPTAAKSFYAVAEVNPGGTETEGGAGTFTDVTGNFFALNVGTAIPPSGTQVVVDPIGGRWVFDYYG